jgi:DHA1 family multidrug resistance protein-like MFS transporter
MTQRQSAGPEESFAPAVASYAADDRATRPIVMLMMAALFSTSIAYSVVLPVLPLILQQSGLSPSDVSLHTGMLTGVYMLTVFLFAPVWGRYSDRVGRRRVILWGLAGTTLAVLGFVVFQSLTLAYVARALTGMFVAAVIPIGTAEVGDISRPESRPHRFAQLTSASLVGFLAGPSLSGWLTNAPWLEQYVSAVASPYVPVLAAAALSGLAGIAVALWLPKRVARAAILTRANDHSVNGSALARATPAVLVLIVMFGLAAFEVAITLRGQQLLGWSPSQIGLLFAECSAVMILIQGVLFSFLIKHVSSRWLLGPGILAMIAGLILMPGTANYDGILLLVMLISAGTSVVTPMLTYWASIGAGLAQGAALGKQTAASSLGQALGSVTVGSLFGIAPAAPFWVAAALLFGGAVLLATQSSTLLRVGAHDGIPHGGD